jgi:hypothetical protein
MSMTLTGIYNRWNIYSTLTGAAMAKNQHCKTVEAFAERTKGINTSIVKPTFRAMIDVMCTDPKTPKVFRFQHIYNLQTFPILKGIIDRETEEIVSKLRQLGCTVDNPV